jgi:hypothetical protein
MLINSITPMVSLFDGDTLHCSQQLAGWVNSIMNIFADYAKITFASFEDGAQCILQRILYVISI